MQRLGTIANGIWAIIGKQLLRTRKTGVGHGPIVTKLLDRETGKVDVNVKGRYGRTLLFYC
jgi:hypothetical protein